MNAEAAGVPLTTADTGIHITHCTARWNERPASIADARDLWSFAAGAANVVMQLSRPGVGHGAVGSKVDAGQQRRLEYLFLMVAFVNRFRPKFIRQGGSYLLLADVRRRIRCRRNLI